MSPPLHGQVVIDDMYPFGVPTSIKVLGYEEDPIAGPWAITAHVFCADA